MNMKKYKTAKAFRVALETRLKQISKEQNTDLQRLRRQVAFDRLLARIFYGGMSYWVLKGGYAMELRMQEERDTIIAFIQGTGDFVVIDDRKGADFCTIAPPSYSKVSF